MNQTMMLIVDYTRFPQINLIVNTGTTLLLIGPFLYFICFINTDRCIGKVYYILTGTRDSHNMQGLKKVEIVTLRHCMPVMSL